MWVRSCFFFFFFNDTATTEIYTLSLTTLFRSRGADGPVQLGAARELGEGLRYHRPWRSRGRGDRKSTRLNSSHLVISYAVFCLKKKTRTRPAHQRLHRGAGGADRGVAQRAEHS